MIKKLSSLFLVLCLTGCITTGPKQSAVKEAPPKYEPDIIDCANLLGADIEKIEKLYGNPDSTRIRCAGKDYFSTMHYRNISCMGRSAYLEIDEQGHNVTRVKIILPSISGNEREQLVERIREEVISKDAKCQKTSPTSQQWKGENGNVVNISFAGSRSLELERTSESWMQFVNRRPIVRSRTAEKKSIPESVSNMRQPRRSLSTVSRDQKTCPYCGGTGREDCIYCVNGKCDTCHGTGRYMGERCPICNGTGKCPDCQGRGWNPCTFCNGTGKIKK
ncbi:hypothetical protein ES702_03473 [subsurface metagenome]